MPRLELDGFASEIGKRDGIGPEEIAILGRGALGHEARKRLHLDLARHGTICCLEGIHGQAFGGNPISL
jgi:hypothetical protein